MTGTLDNEKPNLSPTFYHIEISPLPFQIQSASYRKEIGENESFMVKLFRFFESKTCLLVINECNFLRSL